ncbi:MAG: Stp1/IreP family PP2C-type Ser/Thr phosphatase [Candidatus Amulumruptor caecigallinarius]|nr:Stp1/IreP family PP2C-type Ser/Thr phosphatase [Candidatus Amulumruptor caecigallinarius]
MNQNFIVANSTHVGRNRKINEDSMVTFDSPNGRVVAVCDGMGGQAAGDVASKLACEIIADILTNNEFSTPGEAITRACMAANQGILHKASQNPAFEGMGATCVMAIIKDGLVYYGWIGDSRIYYIRDGKIRQISHDQSYVQQLVDSGEITPKEAEHHPRKNEILNALGIREMTPPLICDAPINPSADSVLLLCSDGLSGMVNDSTISETVSDTSLSLKQRADKLIEIANEKGGLDNITVQLIQFGGRDDSGIVTPEKGKRIARNNRLSMIITVAAVLFAAVFVILFLMPKNNEPANDAIHNTEVRERKPTVGTKPNNPVRQETAPAANAVGKPTSAKTSSQRVNREKVEKKLGVPGEKKNVSEKTESAENAILKKSVQGKQPAEDASKKLEEAVDKQR